MYEVFGSGESKTLSFVIGINSLTELDEAVAKEFPNVPRKQIGIDCTYDREVLVGFNSELEEKKVS